MKRETKYTETERSEMKRNEIYQNEMKRNEYTETEQNRICRNINACSKPDLDDHWSYKWLFLSEEL
jgi:hypothetical protein